MASSIAKQPWRLGVILFLLAVFVVGLLMYQSFVSGVPDEAGTQVTAGGAISSEKPATALPGLTSDTPAGPGSAGGGGATGSGLPGFSPTFATFTALATPGRTASILVTPDIPGPEIPGPQIPPAVPATGSLSGTVFESLAFCGDDCSAEAAPLGNITVYLADASRNLTGQTTITNGAGGFRFVDLTPGEYNLFFADPASAYISDWYVPQTIIAGDNSIVVAADQNTGILMFMKPADAGSDTGGILGVVRNSFGKGIPGVTVMAYLVDEDAGVLLALQNLAVTDIDGRYHITGLPPKPGSGGQTGAAGYKILIAPDPGDGYAPQWYQDQPTYVTAKLISLLPHEEIGGIDAVLTGGGTISGYVTGGGSPLAGVTVDIFDESDIIVGSCLSGPAGAFDSGPLISGSYRLRAAGVDGFLEEWYNDKQSFATADPVAVLLGQGSSGIDIDLDPASHPVNPAEPAIRAVQITTGEYSSDSSAAMGDYADAESPVIESPVISAPDNGPDPRPTGPDSATPDNCGSDGRGHFDTNPPGCQLPGAVAPRR